MKSIRVREFGEPQVMKLEDLPNPVPGPGQVVVSVKAAGVNPAETYIRSGKYANKPPLPYTPGNDAAGIVESVGEGVTNVKPRDRAYVAGSISGTYAQKTLCDATKVHRLPERISFEQGAALGVPYGTAYLALFQRGEGRGGETVLVHGATGGVGIAAVQLAAARGMSVIGTGGTDEGRALVRREGAHLALDHHNPGYADEIMKFTNGAGVNLIIEMLANVNLGKDLTMLARHGRVVVVGSRGEVQINPRDTMSREADVRGMFLGGASANEYVEIHAAIIAGMENGTLRPVIASEIPLAEAPRAHDQVMKAGALGKIVLTV